MNENEFSKCKLVEMNTNESIQTNGGAWWLLPFALYILYETAADPIGSWDSFKRGWNSI